MFSFLRSAFNKTENKTRERIFSYGQIALGSLIGAAAYPLFMTPNNIAPGGLTGLAMILNFLFSLPVGFTSLTLNVPLFLIGYRTMGRIFAFRSLIATALFSLLIDLLPLQPMTMDPLLATLYGGILLGIGLGLILRGGATTGGTDMVARMVHRRIPAITVGAFLFAIDFMVVAAAGLIIGTSEALYALINIFLSAKMIDVVMVGFSGNKACLVISPAWERIQARIMTEMERGVTQLEAKGGYTGESRPTLLCVVSRMEVTAVKRIIREEDEQAFVIVVEANEAIGDGFSGMNQE
ncbi:MAG: YitT family protein [Clostridia bacterium]|nr:YitT family protein [Clostridia bacterium]